MAALAPDDMQVGDYITVLNLKSDKEQIINLMGVPLQIKAICLPYVAATAGLQKITVDVRFVDLMKLSTEYVEAHKIKE